MQRVLVRSRWQNWLRHCCLMIVMIVSARLVLADPITDYNVAVEFYKQQRWDLAADACADFLKRNPADERAATVRIYWAQALLHLQKYQAARDQYRLFLKAAPNHADRPLAMYRTGECSYFLNDYPAAETELLQFLQTYPNHDLTPWGLVYLGESQLRIKKYSQAGQTFQTYVTRYPQGNLIDDAEIGLAAALDMLGQKERAEEVLQRIIARPDSSRAADAIFNLAARRFDDRKFDESAQLFQQIVSRYPKHRLVPAACLNAGYALYYLGKYPEAIAEFQKAVADPVHRDAANYWMGLSRKSMGEFPQAADIFAKTLAASPQSAFAEKLTFHWGDAELRQSHYQKAMELFESVAQKWPTSDLADDALHSACEAALQSGELTRAIELHQEFLRRFPESGLRQVQELLAGRILIAQGDQAGTDSEAGQAAFNQATTLLKHVVESSNVDSTRNFARFQIARIAERQGRDTDVIAELKPLLDAPPAEVTPEFQDALLLSGNAQLRLKDAAGATATYQKYLSLVTTDADKLPGYSGMVQALTATQSWTQLEKMLAEFDQVDQKNEKFGASALAAGDAAFEQRAWSPAVACFQRVLARGLETPYALPALSGLGHAEYEQKQYQLAAETFGKLAAAAKSDEKLTSHSLFMQALSRQQAGKLKEALNLYESTGNRFRQSDRMKTLEPTDLEIGHNAYLCLKGGARVARELGDLNTSDKLYEAAYRELKTQNASEQVELDLLINEWADLSYNAKHFERSDELYAKLIQECPDSPLADDARLILAESLRFGGKKTDAIAAFQQLVDSPQSDDFVLQRSLTHLLDLQAEATKWTEVIQLAERVESKFPGTPQSVYAKYRRGEGELQTRAYAEAAKTLQEVREELSKDLDQAPVWWPEAWLLLAEAEYWQKDYAKMEQVIEDLHALAPDSPLFYRADAIRGRAFENQARFPEARAAYSRVVDSESGRGTETAAEAQFRIAESYLKENNLPVALREYYKVYAGYDAPKYEAAALFQAAACDVSMKHFPQAADTYKKLIAEFPNSEFAQKAQTRLQELESPKSQ